MLIHADVKGLEVVTAAYLSRDPVLMQEVREGTDFHELNKQRFSLPDRTTAKRFKFKLIYGASAYGYAHDSDFIDVSTSEKYWQGIIDEYYAKYKGMAQWHVNLVDTVLSTGQLEMPTGRIYLFDRRRVASNSQFWRPKILNYPVQGTGADLVAIGRVPMWKRLRKTNLQYLFQSTVHDSIDIDVPVDKGMDTCYNVCRIVNQSIEDIPINFQRIFGKPFDLPVKCKIGYGQNLEELTPYNG